MSEARGFVIRDGLTYVLCYGCGGQGWEPDKPWKGEHRNWFPCGTCRNPGDLPEPDHEPTPLDWARQNGEIPR